MKIVTDEKLDFVPVLGDETEFKWGMTLFYICPENSRTFGPAVFPVFATKDVWDMVDEESCPWWGGHRWSLRVRHLGDKASFFHCYDLYSTELPAWQEELTRVNRSIVDHENRVRYYKTVYEEVRNKIEELKKDK